MAARDLDGLQAVAKLCVSAGAQAIVVETDTGEATEVQRLADRAVERFGRIDIWVNNAGIAAFGRFTETPIDVHDQVIRTNLMGYIHGSHAAMKRFLEQDAGTLVNVVSMAGFAPTPLATSYSASKYGNRGFSEALRIELGGHPRIKICDLHPAFVDTPMLGHVANYTGRELTPLPPVVGVDRVARKIVSLAERPREFNPMGLTFPLAVGFHSLAPSVFRWSVARGAKAYLSLSPRTGRTSGTLFTGATRGGPAEGGLRSPGWRIAVAAVSLAGATGAALWAARKRRE